MDFSWGGSSPSWLCLLALKVCARRLALGPKGPCVRENLWWNPRLTSERGEARGSVGEFCCHLD